MKWKIEVWNGDDHGWEVVDTVWTASEAGRICKRLRQQGYDQPSIDVTREGATTEELLRTGG